jgi:hypothetical protein
LLDKDRTDVKHLTNVVETLKEEVTMAGQILVPFNRHVKINDIISVIDAAGKPEMSVVFLIRYPVDSWAWFQNHWVETESSRDAMLTGKKLMKRYSWEGQMALAEDMVAPWRYALEKIGVNVTVDVYAGSLSSAIEEYSRRDEISLVMQAENHLSRMGFLQRAAAFITGKNTAQPGARFRVGPLSLNRIIKEKNNLLLKTRGA